MTGRLTVNAATANTYAGGITGTGSLVKSGAGNLVLSGASSYTGQTSVAAGRLSVNGSLAVTAVPEPTTLAILAAAGCLGRIRDSCGDDWAN